MGQRFQIFVITPDFTDKLEKDLKEYEKSGYAEIAETVKRKVALKDYKDAFSHGIKRTTRYKKYRKDPKEKIKTVHYKATVIAYHNQWLYGRSALFAASNLLRFCDRSGESSAEDSIFHPENHYSQSDPLGMVENLTSILSVFNDPELTTARTGIERMLLLNRTEPDMKDDFTMGDNNDGILIVDAIEKKYCFINISSHYSPGNLTLPHMVPLTAAQYLESYYTSEPESLKFYTAGEESPEDPDMQPGGSWYEKEFSPKAMKENKKENKKYLDRFKGFELLTVEEVKLLFPKVSFPIEQNILTEA